MAIVKEVYGFWYTVHKIPFFCILPHACISIPYYSEAADCDIDKGQQKTANLLHFYQYCDIIIFVAYATLNLITIWWCSILVRNKYVEGGVKIPLKSTSMKFLVLAFVAQTGAYAGS